MSVLSAGSLSKHMGQQASSIWTKVSTDESFSSQAEVESLPSCQCSATWMIVVVVFKQSCFIASIRHKTSFSKRNWTDSQAVSPILDSWLSPPRLREPGAVQVAI